MLIIGFQISPPARCHHVFQEPGPAPHRTNQPCHPQSQPILSVSRYIENMFWKRWLPIPEIGLFHDSHVQDQGYRSPTPDHPLAPSNAYMLVCLCVSVLCPFLLLVQKMTPLSAQLLRPWRCGTWLARGTHPPCHGAPPAENHFDLPGK